MIFQEVLVGVKLCNRYKGNQHQLQYGQIRRHNYVIAEQVKANVDLTSLGIINKFKLFDFDLTKQQITDTLVEEISPGKRSMDLKDPLEQY